MKANTKKWAPHEDALLRQMWADGVVFKMMTRRLGRCQTAIWRRARKLKLPSRARVAQYSRALHFPLAADDYAKIQRICAQRGQPVAVAVRKLVVEHFLGGQREEATNTGADRDDQAHAPRAGAVEQDGVLQARRRQDERHPVRAA